jgi:hypothetical protein
VAARWPSPDQSSQVDVSGGWEYLDNGEDWAFSRSRKDVSGPWDNSLS